MTLEASDLSEFALVRWFIDHLANILGLKMSERRAERRVVSGLLNYLSGRRVLYSPMTLEEPKHVAKSVFQARKRIDRDLRRLQPDANAVQSFIDIREACVDYLNAVPNPARPGADWPAAVGALRLGVQLGIEALEVDYQLRIPHGTGRATRTREFRGRTEGAVGRQRDPDPSSE